MWPAIVCVVAAYIPGDIKRVAQASDAGRHRSLWAVAHLIANGDLGSIILFGSFLAWAVFDRIALKRRSDPGAPPFPRGGRGNDIVAVVLGTLLYLALWVIGSIRSSSACRLSRDRIVSTQDDIKRLTAPDIRARKGGEPIVCLTSYHAHTARLVDRYCDVILVGDSLGMVMHGLETTVPVTLDMMILQGHAVMRGSQARAGRRRHAVRLLRGSRRSRRSLRCARVMKETALRRDQARRRPRAWRRPSPSWSSAACR